MGYDDENQKDDYFILACHCHFVRRLGDALVSICDLTNESGEVTLNQSYYPYGNAISSEDAGSSIYGFDAEQMDYYIGNLDKAASEKNLQICSLDGHIILGGGYLCCLRVHIIGIASEI
jgi:hypothetical protein